jgi:hypothetical protein
MSRRFLAPALAAVAFALAAGGDDDFPITNWADRIEEDWVLVVGDTTSTDGPQVNTVMTPVADLSQPVVVLDMNYKHDPSYSPGGIQALVFDQVGMRKSNVVASDGLDIPGETVTWTQRMTLSGGTVKYYIPALTSTTWGNFSLTDPVISFNTTLTSFARYDPSASATNSGGAWKTKGLNSLTLVQVRYYLGSTLLYTDTTTRTVDCSKPFTRP